MVTSKYQQDIYNALLTTTSNLVVKSTAGSGKTTTLVGCCKQIPYGKRVLFAAFNKHTVNELKLRLPPDVTCQTLHSIGLKAISANYQSITVNDNKQIDYIMPLFEREKSHKTKWSKIYEADKLLKLVRATMTQLEKEKVEELAVAHNLYPDEDILESVVLAGRSLRDYNEQAEEFLKVDFLDMVAVPALDSRMRLPQFDFVLLDESQDFSKLDQVLLERLVKKPRGRLIAVGDDRQAIYSFRGADVNSFQYFIDRPNTLKLPLTISYRCGKQIVAHAAQVYPEIESWSESKEGIVRKGDLSEVRDGDLVLCRNVRPLVHAFFDLVEKYHKKCTIVGKEIEKGLLNVLAGLDSESDVVELTNHITNLKSVLTDKLARKGHSNPTAHVKYEALCEQTGVVERVASNYATIGQVEEKIRSIFQDESVANIRLMTIHKSKGLESNRVFLIECFEKQKLIPNKHAVTADQLTQEKNLLFVAYTRAKDELVKVEL